jgi:hypothetical protein
MNEQVRLLPVNGRLEIELAGTLAGILALTSNNPRRDARGLKVTVVAILPQPPTVDSRISSGVTVLVRGSGSSNPRTPASLSTGFLNQFRDLGPRRSTVGLQ